MGLFTPIWMRDDLRRGQYGRVKSKIVRLPPDELAKAALEAPDSFARRIAAENLSDQSVLAAVARKDSAMENREAALRRLTDQNALAQIVKKEPSERIRMAALEKLTDQELLADCAAARFSDRKLVETVIGRLTEQSLLARFAVRSENTDIRRMAVEKLDDQRILAQIAGKDKAFSIRKLALEKIADPAVKARLIQKETAGYAARIEKEKDIKRLTEIAENLFALGSEEGVSALVKGISSIPEGETRYIGALKTAAALLKEHYKRKNQASTGKNRTWHYDVMDTMCPYEHTDEAVEAELL